MQAFESNPPEPTQPSEPTNFWLLQHILCGAPKPAGSSPTEVERGSTQNTTTNATHLALVSVRKPEYVLVSTAGRLVRFPERGMDSPGLRVDPAGAESVAAQ
ncbi:hypothetical protein AB0C34_00975 [Nocardia sp. NPDC049220]|uniref:hypothetical protein n=1 Tax=Nocardia sp. NPDC049220 TaxID=3155273 RepID=UPI0033DBF4CA